MSVEPQQLRVEDVMTRDMLSLRPADTVDATARLMRQRRIGSVPIVDKDKLVGIVTRSDILEAYLGLYERMKQSLDPQAP